MQTACYSYYSGKKESEKTCLEELIEKQKMWSHNFTFDALHLRPILTSKIEAAGGVYIIGLKGNQGVLSEQMILHSELEVPIETFENTEIGHSLPRNLGGRTEERHYEAYDISDVLIDERWSKSGFKSLFKVRRITTENKTGKVSDDTSFYISNAVIEPSNITTNARTYFKAIRNHWTCEVVNHYRDVTLKEDNLKTKFSAVSKITSAIRTLIINALMMNKPKNMVALLDHFNDDFDFLISYLRVIRFL